MADNIATITGDVLATALQSATVQPTVVPFTTINGRDTLMALNITPDSAASLGTHNITLSPVGARSKAADTAADKLMRAALDADGGALYLLPIPVVVGDDGRSKAQASRIEMALDKAYLRLSNEERLRLMYGRASDSVQTVTVCGVQVQASVPGMIYVMAVGGAVKSHPIMGRVYRELVAKH